jgi:hypothetical protein
MKTLLCLLLITTSAFADLRSNCIASAVAKAGAQPETLDLRMAFTIAANDEVKAIIAMKLEAIHRAAVADGVNTFNRLNAQRDAAIAKQQSDAMYQQMIYWQTQLMRQGYNNNQWTPSPIIVLPLR